MKQIFGALAYSKQLKPYYLLVSFFSILVAIATLMQPFLLKWVIDEFETGLPRASQLILLVVLYFALDFSITIFTNIGGYFGDMMEIKLRRHLSEQYYKHLLQLPQRYFDNERTGALVNRLSRSIENLTTTIKMFSNNFLQLLFTTVFTLVITAAYSPIAAFLMLILYPLLLWLTRRSSEQWQEIEKEKNGFLDEAFGRFTEVIGQIRVVKSFRQNKNELHLFQNKFGETIALTSKQSKLWHNQDVLRRLMLNLIFTGIFATIIWQTFKGSLSLSELVLILGYTNLIRLPLFSLSFIVDSVQRAIAGSKDFFEVLALDTEPKAFDEPDDIAQIDRAECTVVFDDVCFAYDEDDRVLNNLNFVINPGEKLALVSESGGGKSTIANLLMGLYHPTAGSITLGSENTTDQPFYWLREQVGVVFQDADLFSGTILSNISYGRPDADIEEVERVAELANAHEFISKFKDGYHTEIGERGIKLSGGQQQRIAIARALLKDAPILILDEATSALDSKTEVEVQAALETLMEGRTSLIIAHRLSTIANVDTIITLADGTIDEIGTPAELSVSGGTYGQLLQLQSADPEERKKYLKQFDLH